MVHCTFYTFTLLSLARVCFALRRGEWFFLTSYIVFRGKWICTCTLPGNLLMTAYCCYTDDDDYYHGYVRQVSSWCGVVC